MKNKIFCSLVFVVILLMNVVNQSCSYNDTSVKNQSISFFTKVFCGYWNSFAVKSDGTVWGWGANWYGQLGNGTREDDSQPQQIKKIENVIKVAAGISHVIALKKDGTVWGWGANFYGQTGCAQTVAESITAPTKIEVLQDIIDIACGDSQSMALKKDGTVWTWGYNNKGQLGIGTFKNKAVPEKISTLTNIKKIAAGEGFSVAVKNDGTVWCWGHNNIGQLGNGTFYDCCEPVKIDSIPFVDDIACGSSHCVALCKDGTVWSWGANGNGQLGNGSVRCEKKPIQLRLKYIVKVCAGNDFSLALCKDGEVWAWGKNSLILKSSTRANSIPSKIKKLVNIKIIDAKNDNYLCICKNNNVMSCGDNWKGQLGNGTNTYSYLPQKVIFNNSSLLKKDHIAQNKISSSNYTKCPLTSSNVSNDIILLPDLLIKSNIFSSQWGLCNNGQSILGQKCKYGIDINILPAWEITQGSVSTTVGILDTGIDINCSCFNNRILYNNAEIPNNGIDDDGNGYIDDISGWDFYNHDKSVFDNSQSDAHGTQVAGIVAANPSKEISSGIIGVAPKIRLLSLKIMNNDSGNIVDIIRAINYAKTFNVKIINCSWGWTDIKYNLVLKDAIKNTNILFVCSAGNKRSYDEPVLFFPACLNLPNILSVTSVNYDGVIDPSSNYGKNIDVAAPGVGIISCMPDNKYSFVSGTSFAAPFVSGIAALIESEYSDINCYKIKEKIIKSVHVYKELDGKVSSDGIVDAYSALK